jgi:hypothetical protein
MKQELFTILQRHDESNPIKRKYLLEQLGLPPTSSNDRNVRKLIHEMRVTDEIPILSTSGNPAGYYITLDYAVLNQAEVQMENHIIHLAEVLRALKHGGARYIANQRHERQLVLV